MTSVSCSESVCTVADVITSTINRDGRRFRHLLWPSKCMVGKVGGRHESTRYHTFAVTSFHSSQTRDKPAHPRSLCTTTNPSFARRLFVAGWSRGCKSTRFLRELPITLTLGQLCINLLHLITGDVLTSEIEKKKLNQWKIYSQLIFIYLLYATTTPHLLGTFN